MFLLRHCFECHSLRLLLLLPHCARPRVAHFETARARVFLRQFIVRGMAFPLEFMMMMDDGMEGMAGGRGGRGKVGGGSAPSKKKKPVFGKKKSFQ